MPYLEMLALGRHQSKVFFADICMVHFQMVALGWITGPSHPHFNFQ